MNQDHAKSGCATAAAAREHEISEGAARWGEAIRRGGLLAAVAAGVLLVGASPAGAVGRAFFGVVPADRTATEEFRTMGAAKVGSYRFGLGWSDVQPTEDAAYDWASTDREVENAALNGIELLPTASGNPGFVSGDEGEPPLGSSADEQGWRDFLAAAVARYGPGGDFWRTFTLQHPGVEPRPIGAWQIWNEQNSPSFFKPKPSPRRYAKLLEISDEAISGIDPGAKIILGGMFATPSRNQAIYSWRFVKRLYEVSGAKRHFNAIALHPYSPNLRGIKAQVKLVRKQLKKAGAAGTRIWITELGWGSAGTNEDALIKSPAGQQKMLRKSFNLILDRRGKWKIERLFWYAWRDPADVGAVCGFCRSAGLLESDLDPKPSFDQFRRFTGGR